MKQEGDSIDVRQNLDDNTVCNIKVCDDKNNTKDLKKKKRLRSLGTIEVY
jgi:hypothetical protein